MLLRAAEDGRNAAPRGADHGPVWCSSATWLERKGRMMGLRIEGAWLAAAVAVETNEAGKAASAAFSVDFGTLKRPRSRVGLPAKSAPGYT